MEEFQSVMVQVDGGEALVLAPRDLGDRVAEAQLEKWVIENPALAGEPLLILGSQLAEFAEDKDRLDVLALDMQGEIVLIELKVDGQFRLTDLQALAYAAGYAGMRTDHFAEILRKRLERDGDSSVTLERAKEAIVEFVDVLDEFDEWQPSRRVRIKLLAPGYPKRVLQTVKWLGDVYGMPIEAVQVQLYEDAAGRYQLTFERLLPLKSDDVFDLTVRAAEERIAGASKARRPAILKTLLENGILHPGQKLWLHPSIFAPDDKHLFDPTNPIFEVTLDLSEGKPMFRWRPSPDAPQELLVPSAAWWSIFQQLLPDAYPEPFYVPVHSRYSLEPGGPTLGEVAEQHGIW
jgi:hypothetical protein